MGANGAGGYNLTDSLRFRSSASAYLERTPTTAGNRQTWTWSAWVKRGTLNSGTTQYTLFSNNSANTDAGYMSIHFRADALRISGFNTIWRTTSQVFRDPSAWYHIVVVWDTTQATAADRVKLYINGSQVTAFSTSNNPTLNATSGINANTVTYIGANVYSGTEYFDGYLTEVNFVDGQALDPTYFGEYNEDTGVWQPKKYTGTYGTNGFYLNMSTSGSTVTDQSGNGNDWTANNMNLTTSTATTYDKMTDVPTLTDEDTSNFATLNPLASNSVSTLSNANLDSTSSTVYYNERATIELPSSGKWYFESYLNTIDCVMGVMKSSIANNVYMGFTTDAWIFVAVSGNKANGSQVSYDSASVVGQTIGIAMNMDNGELTFYRNGVSLGVAFTIADTSNLVFGIGQSTNALRTVNANFGQRPFAYTPPTGYLKLNTFNLPDSSIVDGSQYMNPVLYTGNGSTNAITGVGFSPDLVWGKNRGAVASHNLLDTVRGATKRIFSNSTEAEVTTATSLTSFDSDGFTLGSDTGLNTDTNTYVAWNWRGSDSSPVSNTNGTLASQVSANPTAGFSIVTYTGVNTTSTIGHGLGVAPKFIITKLRNVADGWYCYHESIGNNKFIRLDSTGATTTSTIFGNTSPTPIVFTNELGNYTCVAYCFAEVEGFSKIGSYTGNGSTDGPFVYTGFRPAYVLVKNSTTGGLSWVINDTSRDTYNECNKDLIANGSSAESNPSPGRMDILSNGFKIRSSANSVNQSGNTLIYMAFAENPFKNSLAR